MRWDIASLIGILVAAFGLFGGQWVEGGHLASLIQPTAFLIVVCGTIGAVLLQSPLKVFVRAVRMVGRVFSRHQFQGDEVVRQVVRWSERVRREGLLALEGEVGGLGDPLTRMGVQMLVDGFDEHSLRDALDVQLSTQQNAARDAVHVWEAAGGYAPTIGILGAVLGLIHVMENLADPGKLGGGIAVAFVATIYGVALANLVFLPIAGKLRALARLDLLRGEMLQDGLIGIAHGENPRLIEFRLQAYFDGHE